MKIRALVIDVDGTLTDGGIYVGNSGEVFKRFCVKDGYAIHDLLPQMNIIPIVITGRQSDIVTNRCRELGISHVVQGSKDKIADMEKILAAEKITKEETAYIGDDMNDFECMKVVAVRGCPDDAVEGIKEISDFVTKCNGGQGAVREFVEWLSGKIEQEEKYKM